MKQLIAGLALLLSGPCVFAAPPDLDALAQTAAAEPVPVCEQGHEEALVDGVVSIRPGQTICIELRIAGDAVVPARVVSVRDPKNTLILKFSQDEKNNMWVLSLHNPLQTFLDYNLLMLRPGQDDFESTSNCPVLSHRQGIEYWPHSIEVLKIKDFKALPESANMTCS